MKDMSFIKKNHPDYLTIRELSWKVDRSVEWLRQLEREGRIPAPPRVKRGALMIRLYPPALVDEIQQILSTLKPGRPPST